MMYRLLGVVLFIFKITSAQIYETGDNSTVHGCSTHCSYEDPTLECWNSTLKFYERVLLGHMRHYIAVQINIDQWHRRHDDHYTTDFDKVIADSNQTMQSFLAKNDSLDAATISTVVHTLIKRVEKQSDRKISWVPHFSCPLPCEYKYTVWRNLFIVSAILNLCLIAVVIPFARRMTRKYETEALISG